MQSDKAPTARPLERMIRPFQEFIHTEASGGILLLAMTALALGWANSPFAQSYRELWHAPVTAGIGPFVLSKPLELWINGQQVKFFLPKQSGRLTYDAYVTATGTFSAEPPIIQGFNATDSLTIGNGSTISIE